LFPLLFSSLLFSSLLLSSLHDFISTVSFRDPAWESILSHSYLEEGGRNSIPGRYTTVTVLGRWERHVACMGGVRNAYSAAVGKLERMRFPGRTSDRRWTQKQGVDWIRLARDSIHGRLLWTRYLIFHVL
jgi:hypothetical protein